MAYRTVVTVFCTACFHQSHKLSGSVSWVSQACSCSPHSHIIFPLFQWRRHIALTSHRHLWTLSAKGCFLEVSLTFILTLVALWISAVQWNNSWSRRRIAKPCVFWVSIKHGDCTELLNNDQSPSFGSQSKAAISLILKSAAWGKEGSEFGHLNPGRAQFDFSCNVKRVRKCPISSGILLLHLLNLSVFVTNCLIQLDKKSLGLPPSPRFLLSHAQNVPCLPHMETVVYMLGN